jgi:hypothetical protein
MLRNYSKINGSLQAVQTGWIVGWKGEKRDLYYVKGILVDYPRLIASHNIDYKTY